MVLSPWDESSFNQSLVFLETAMTYHQDVYADTDTLLARLAGFFSSRQVNAYLVGGCIRDALMGRPPGRDLDLAVQGDALQLGRALADSLGGGYGVIGREHGVARVLVPGHGAAPGPADGLADGEGRGAASSGWTIDLASFTGTIEDDLARRDFTIDAMAVPLTLWNSDSLDEVVIDPLNGRQDLLGKLVRAVGPGVFREDPGRLLRAVRLAGQLRFRLTPETARMVGGNAHLVGQVPGERLRDEFLAILALDGARPFLEVLDRLDLLCRVIPELEVTKGVDQPRMHYWDVWGHLIHTVEYAEGVTNGHQHSPVYSLTPWDPQTRAHFDQVLAGAHTRRTYLKLAGLLHDIAKPQTKSVDETGRTRFLGHSELGADMVRERLTQLRLPNKVIDTVATMVNYHLRPDTMWQGLDHPTPRAVHRYFRDLGDAAIDTLYLSLADYLAAKGPEYSLEDWGLHARMVAYLLDASSKPRVSDRKNRLVTGRDLIEKLQLEPGPIFGEILDRIDEAQGTGEISSRDEGLALAACLLEDIRSENVEPLQGDRQYPV